MKRLQIYIEEEMDDALAAEAARCRVSKAALIRQYVAERIGQEVPDPLDAIVGWLPDLEPGNIDDIVYGPR